MSLVFEHFALDQERRQLLRARELVPLNAKAFELLTLLLARRPRVLSKSQIRDVLWPGRTVGETSLPRLVTELRQALNDDPQHPRFIRTAHGFGYAFCGEAHEDGAVRPGEVAVRAPGEERPYPGLSAFTEADAGRFFGRETEAAALWEKLGRQKLVALIGPSGVGKTSFLRAGVIPKPPAGWDTRYLTPGASPAAALARALTPSLASDPDGLAELVQGAMELVQTGEDGRVVSAVLRWRRRTNEALLVIDQFEELFTLNPEETHQRFAVLLGRLADEADVHVLLSLRDDFLFRCHAYPSLAPVFREVTPLGPPSADALRRALVEPAARLGARFEDETLVGEMVKSVEKERGALPLLAFAAARLWEERDRERKRLTRAAYLRIRGVEGALAEHAEATLREIGPERERLVREILRNLVTAEGTRAAREREDLLSVFAQPNPDREEAEAVLDVLVGARLLTEYDDSEGSDGGGRARVEVVHESLLTHWPRLERWRAQDQEGALLRDQLRQAARLWDEKGRPEELLWTGQAHREYVTWRGRYEGSLSALEESFAQGMTVLAGRRRRRRRAAVALLLAAVGAVAVTTSVLWRRSEVARQKATSEVRAREAAELLALGRLRLVDYPSAALAYAIASLERLDNEPARRFAVEALWLGPTALVLSDPILPREIEWSPDGRWLALGGPAGLILLDRDSGKRRLLASAGAGPVGFTADSSRLVTRPWGALPTVHIWSLPEVLLLESWTPEGMAKLPEDVQTVLVDRHLFTITFDPRDGTGDQAALVTMRSLDGGAERTLGRWRPHRLSDWDLDPSGEWLNSVQDGQVLQQRLEALAQPPLVLGRHSGQVSLRRRPWVDRFATADEKGEVRLWNARTGRLERTLKSPADARHLALDPKGRFAAAAPFATLSAKSFCLFDLKAPPYTEPLPLLDHELPALYSMAFDPQGQWLASGHELATVLWNLAGKRSTVLGGQKSSASMGANVAFTPEGRLVATTGGGVRVWPPLGTDGDVRELRPPSPERALDYLSLESEGRRAVVVERGAGRVITLPLDGSPASVHPVDGARPRGALAIATMSLHPAGRRVALACLEFGRPETASLRILDLSTGSQRTLPPLAKREGGECEQRLEAFGAVDPPLWLPDGRLVADGYTGLRVFDLSDGSSRWLRPCRAATSDLVNLRATPDSRAVVSLHGSTDRSNSSDLSITDLADGATRVVTSHGKRLTSLGLDPSGTILVTGDADGLVRVGPLSGGEPHLLYGHTRRVMGVAVSPDGKWIASASDDETIRLWPMPEGRPLHALPHETLLTTLRSLTNLRVVADPSAATGYRVAPGPLPSWREPPAW